MFEFQNRKKNEFIQKPCLRDQHQHAAKSVLTIFRPENQVCALYFQCIEFDFKTMKKKKKKYRNKFCLAVSSVRCKGIENELAIELMRVRLFSFNRALVSCRATRLEANAILSFIQIPNQTVSKIICMQRMRNAPAGLCTLCTVRIY